MDARLNLYDSTMAAKFAKYINSSGAAVTDSTLPAATQELVKIRASQINGCAGCLDMHTKDAEHRGETSERLHLVAAWREAMVFTEAEKAALELTEQGTRLADGAGVSDEAWANAARHYDDEQLGAAGVPDRPHQHLQPFERHHSAARRRLPARSVGMRAKSAIVAGSAHGSASRHAGPAAPKRAL